MKDQSDIAARLRATAESIAQGSRVERLELEFVSPSGLRTRYVYVGLPEPLKSGDTVDITYSSNWTPPRKAQESKS